MDDNDLTQLHPELLDENGNFKFLPPNLKERREKELGILNEEKAPAESKDEDNQPPPSS